MISWMCNFDIYMLSSLLFTLWY